MKIIGIHTEHDGAVAFVEDGRLTGYIEAQKDNRFRYAKLKAKTLDEDLEYFEGEQDVLAIGGWFRRDGGYHGCEDSVISVGPLDDNEPQVQQFCTSHERAHIFSSYSLSPFEQGKPCYALIYDGDIGTFCSIDKDCKITRIATPVTQPGQRYSFLFELASRDYSDQCRGYSFGVAGKLMARASLRDNSELRPEEQELMSMLLDEFDSLTLRKSQFRPVSY